MNTNKHVVIIVAWITFLGTVLAAVITNFDKIFLTGKSDSKILLQPMDRTYENTPENSNENNCNIEWVDNDNDRGIYTGNCLAGKPHGAGTMKYMSGDIYSGDFVNGHLQGEGSYHWKSGDSFVGEFLNNRIKGKGVLKLTNGIKQEGIFDNLKFLSGTMFGPDGVVATGTFLETGQLKDGTFSTPSKTCLVRDGKLVKKSCVSKN
ncbi:MAG TPA: hypothetical protein ENJ08_06660 [Gammaproteobacteria bacterium]|nr:hypothetical protein [Gammaproteobacteria bacterium]